ncbi:hypothetical protein [Streptomyces sp. NPDC056883]|uniref:hypothetical protein n=1 Tax=Streptomyces sp. NPDC056883 TaxID=3345959 RepID=UPI0036741622
MSIQPSWNPYPARPLGPGPFTEPDPRSLGYDDDGHPGISFAEAVQSRVPVPVSGDTAGLIRTTQPSSGVPTV